MSDEEKKRQTKKMRKVLAWAAAEERRRNPGHATIDPERRKLLDAVHTPSLKSSRKIIRKAGGRVGP